MPRQAVNKHFEMCSPTPDMATGDLRAERRSYKELLLPSTARRPLRNCMGLRYRSGPARARPRTTIAPARPPRAAAHTPALNTAEDFSTLTGVRNDINIINAKTQAPYN